MEIWKPAKDGSETWLKSPFLPFPLPEGQNLRDVLLQQSHNDPTTHYVVFTLDEETCLEEHVQKSLGGLIPKISDPLDFFLSEVVCNQHLPDQTIHPRFFPFTLDQDSTRVPGVRSVFRRCFWVNRGA